MKKNAESLLQMEAIEDNLVYGELKIDTDKERVYVDTKNKKVYQSLSGYGFDGVEDWETQKYSFEDWDV